MVLPLSFLLSCSDSAEVMADEVARTYSRAAVSEGSDSGTDGHSAVWIDEGCLALARVRIASRVTYLSEQFLPNVVAPMGSKWC